MKSTSLRLLLAPVLLTLCALPAAALDEVVVKRRAVLHDFAFESGETIPQLELGVEHYGQLAPTRDNVVLICHFLAGDSHAAGVYQPGADPGWWDELIGPGAPIDTDRYFVVCMDLPCNMKATKDPMVISGGPASVDPRTGDRYGTHFPDVTVRDMVHSQRAVLDMLGVRHLACVTGPSLGGMLAWQFGIEYPDYVDLVLPVGAPVSFTAEDRSGFRNAAGAIELDPSWQWGDYYDTPYQPDYGVALALHGLSALTDPVSAWSFFLDVHRYVSEARERYDANHYLYLIRAHESYELGQEYGSLDAAFQRVRARVLVVGYEDDPFISPDRLREAARALDDAGVRERLVLLQGSHGHLSVLYDLDELAPVFRQALN